jgi:hypothetical protein
MGVQLPATGDAGTDLSSTIQGEHDMPDARHLNGRESGERTGSLRGVCRSTEVAAILRLSLHRWVNSSRMGVVPSTVLLQPLSQLFFRVWRRLLLQMMRSQFTSLLRVLLSALVSVLRRQPVRWMVR